MRMRYNASARAPRQQTRALLCLALCGSIPGAAGAAAITGICPDGSVYIVQTEAQIPCADSKQVAPHEVPPIRPEYLPKPYTWQVWSEAQDPNNPYNLIDAARQVRGAGVPDAAGTADGSPSISAGPPGTPTSADAVGPLDLGLGDQELRNLFMIVELTQEKTPVQFARNTADGRGVFRVALAHSSAFEERLAQAWSSRGGLGDSRVVLFTALSKRPAEFHANFTFVQKHLSYQPDGASPRQLGILQGRLGSLQADEAVLGYVVLPEAMDLSREIDVYWNDRRTSARFRAAPATDRAGRATGSTPLY